MLIWQPRVINDNLAVRMQSLVDLARFPIPKDDIARACTRGNVSAVWGKANRTGVTRDGMPRESLLLVLLETSIGVVYEDLVVERLTCEVFPWAGSVGCLASVGC